MTHPSPIAVWLLGWATPWEPRPSWVSVEAEPKGA